MKKSKLFPLKIMMFTLLLFVLALAGCSMDTDNTTKEIPLELRNTAWTRQINSETVTLALGTNRMTISGCSNAQWNGEWNCVRSGTAGCCIGDRFFDPEAIQFSYGGDNLCISGCTGRMSYLNGDWTQEN